MALDKSKMIVSSLASHGVAELDNTVGNVLLAATKTVKENKTAIKALGLGVAANVAVHALDLDAMATGIGLDSLLGVDAFIDNAADVAMLAAGAKLANDFARNVSETLEHRKTNEELLAAFGIEDNNSSNKLSAIMG